MALAAVDSTTKRLRIDALASFALSLRSPLTWRRLRTEAIGKISV
jgi:hypothetical protein